MNRIISVLVALVLSATLVGTAKADQPTETRQAELETQRMNQELIEAANNAPIEADKAMPVKSLKPGADDAYITSPYGRYPRRKGTILVTPDKFKGLIPTGHAAIVYSRGSVVESIQSGVKVRSNNWYRNKHQAYGVTVRGTSVRQDAGAANYARRQVGKRYNYNYFNVNTRSKFYCSQLVWAAFKDLYGVDLNTWRWGRAIHPMELVQSSKTRLIWRKR